MKKLLKFIPLLLLPLALSSCTLFQEQDDPNAVYPTSLTISGETELELNQSTLLKAKYKPRTVTYTTINWETSSKAIATVDKDGNVTGKKDGTVTITAWMKGANKTKVTATHEMYIGTPAATGLELSQTTLTMGFGSTTTLYANVLPAKSNQAVNWTTSNSSVVSLNKTSTTGKQETVTLTAGSSLGTATITATSVDGHFSQSCNVSVKEVSGTTVFIYMCGADLESDGGYATSDLNEILSVNSQPSDVNIIVQTGGAKSWKTSKISASKSQRWQIRNKQLNLISEESKKNMGLQSTFQDFLTWGLQTYKSAKYGLIMWNHGGAMDGCCYDEQFNNDCLTPLELYNGVTNARNTAGASKLDWIAYDACLMAVQDIAEYNSYNFNYMLSSQESEAGYGYDYDAWLPTLYANPSVSTKDLLELIGHSFMVEEKALYQANGWGAFDQTQSVLDLSKMSAYKSAFESFASSLNDIIGTNGTKAKTLGNAIKSAQKYGATEDDYGQTVYPFDVYDVSGALTKIVAKSDFSSLSTSANAVKTALGQLVVYEEHGSGTTGSGICLFCPISGYNYAYDASKGPTSNFTNWKTVANKVYNQF